MLKPRRSSQRDGLTPIDLSSPAGFVPFGLTGISLSRLESDAGPLWIPADDEVMRPFIETYGCWEPEEGQLLRSLGSDDMVFLDIGASFGYFSRLMAKHFPNARVEAFEPHPMMASLLALNTWEFGRRVTVWPTALGRQRGSLGLTMAEHNVGDIRVDEENGTFDAVAPVSPLDELVGGRVDLVKLDVQGFETDVMAGMSNAVRTNPHIKIVLEFWPTAISGRRLRPFDILHIYRSLGFELCLLRERAATPATDDEILLYATRAGSEGQATLLLRRA